MAVERCDLTDLPKDGCSHCRGLDRRPDPVPENFSRWWTRSKFIGRCVACEDLYPEGSRIRHGDYLGYFGWIAECCATEEESEL